MCIEPGCGCAERDHFGVSVDTATLDEIAEKQRAYREEHRDEIAEKKRPKYSSPDAVWDPEGHRICPVCRTGRLHRNGDRGRYPRRCDDCKAAT
jgi:hypothetical protein